MIAQTRLSHDFLVIGAGITGLSAALALGEAGFRTHVIDAYGPAAMASGWTLAGVRQSGRDPAELPLAQKAVSIWETLSDKLGAPVGYRQEGNLRLARTNEEIETIRALVESQTHAGLKMSFLDDAKDIKSIAPALSDAVLAASYCPTDGHADPQLVAQAYLKAAEAKGVTFGFGERVQELIASGGKITTIETDRRRFAAGSVLLATGFLSNSLLSPLGCPLNLRKPIVTVLQSAPMPPCLAPVLGVANADLAARQEASGQLRVTSGMEEWNGSLMENEGKPVIRPTARSIAATIDKVKHVLPCFGEAEIEKIWVGALDLTPDALPVIDFAPGLDNLVIAAGFSGHGFGIGPVTGPLASQLLSGKEPDLDISAFRMDRFANQQGSAAPLTLHG